MSVAVDSAEEIPPERLQDCIAVVTGAAELDLRESDISNIQVQTGGLFNFLLRVSSTRGTHFFKQYLDGTSNATFGAVPPSPAAQRADLAYEVQQLATEATTQLGDVVPRIVHYDRERSAFLMEPAKGDRNLIEAFIDGEIPDAAVTLLPRALGRLHQSTYGRFPTDSPLANTTFRDFKLGIQYDNIAKLLDEDEARIVMKTKGEYQDRTVCVTHGDPNSRNVIVGRNEMGLYDFEQSHMGGPEYDLSYIMCEMWIAMERSGRKPAHTAAIKKFLDNYFSEFTAENRQDVETATTNHLATQIVYRFLGPSRALWTSHIDEADQERIIGSAREMLSPNPRPVSEVLAAVRSAEAATDMTP